MAEEIATMGAAAESLGVSMADVERKILACRGCAEAALQVLGCFKISGPSIPRELYSYMLVHHGSLQMQLHCRNSGVQASLHLQITCTVLQACKMELPSTCARTRSLSICIDCCLG